MSFPPFQLIRLLLFTGVILVCSTMAGPAQDKAKKASPKAPDKNAEIDGKLVFAHGPALPGKIFAADAKTVSWKSPDFTQPAQLRHGAIRSVELNREDPAPIPNESLVATLRDGGILYGDLLGFDDDSITLKGKRMGEVKLRRDQVLGMHWLRQGNLLVNGPTGEAGWIYKTGVSEGRRWQGTPGGKLKSVAWKQRTTMALELPEMAEVAFRVRSSERPQFECQLFEDMQNAILRTWDDELVIRRGSEHLKVMTLDDKDREVALRIFWNRKDDSGLIAMMDGTILAQWRSDSTKAGELTTENGAPLVFLHERKFESSENAVPDGVTFYNSGRDLTIDQLEIRQWNGELPRSRKDPKTHGIPRLTLTSGETLGIFSGTLLRGDAKGFDFEPSGAPGTTRRIPLSDIESLILDEVTNPKPSDNDPEPVEIQFTDGTLWHGNIESMTDDRLRLKTPYSESPFDADTKGLLTMKFSGKPEPEFTDGTYHRGAKLTVDKRTVHGHWEPAEGDRPHWLLPGAEKAVPMVEARAFQILRAPPSPDFVIPKAPALMHLSNWQILPAKLNAIGPEGKWVEFRSDLSETSRLEAAEIRAIQFPGADLNPKGFSDRGWRSVRGKKDSNVVFRAKKPPVEKKDKKEAVEDDSRAIMTLKPGGAWGHESILQGNEIKFNMTSDGWGTMRLRLFGSNTDSPDAECTRLLLGHFGDEIYCGAEQTPGDFSIRRDIPADANKPIPIRIVWEAKKLTLHVKGQLAVTVPISDPYPRNGLSLVFETANLWGNGERDVTISNFALTAAPGMVSSPPVPPETKERALVIPRFRRDDAPKHALLAWNGDLLRGTVETATQDQIAFRTGLESHRIPADRVAAAIWLRPPVEKEQPEEPKTETPPEEKPDPKAEAMKAIRNGGAAVVIGGLGGEVRLIQGGGAVRMVQPDARKKEETGNALLPSIVKGQHTLRLHNGGELTMIVDSFGPEIVTGHTDLLGRCRIPIDLIGTIRTGTSSQSGGGAVFADWQLEHAPEPAPTEGDGGGANSPLIGKAAPPIDLPLLNGGNFKSPKGKVVVLDFWATWCGPCVQALPAMIKTFSQFSPDEVEFVAVNQAESPEIIKKFLDQRGWPPFTVALDAKQDVGRAYGMEGIPYTVIVDQKGIVSWVTTGFRPGGDADAAKAVQDLLDAAKAPSSE